MTIDEAIEQYKHISDSYKSVGNTEDAMETRQIAEWLSLLKVYTDTGMAKEAQRARHEMHGWQLEWKREMERRKELEAENAKLRELVAHYERAVTVHDVKPAEVLEWSVRCDALRKELGIEMEQ